MKLLLLYGPPAVGKLTVAKHLVQLTGYRLFHNHLCRDAIAALHPGRTRAFTAALDGVRFRVIEAALVAGFPGLISTYVFLRGEDEAYVDRVVELVEAHHGDLHFVHLLADRPTLEQRVSAASRRPYGKLQDASAFARMSERYDVFSPVPGRPSLRVDTSQMDPAASARLIWRALDRMPQRGP